MGGVALHDVQEKVAAFLRAELAGEKERALVEIQLIHAPEGMAPEVMREWSREVPADEPYFQADLAYVDRLAADIHDLAEERAAVFRTADNLFKLRSARANGGRRSYVFRMLPMIDQDSSVAPAVIGTNYSPDRSANGADPPTERGVLSQQMRSNSELMRHNRDMTAGTIGVLSKLIADLRDQVATKDAEIAKMYAEQRAERIAERNHELEVVRQHNKEARKDALVGKAIQLMPVALSRLLTDGKSDNSSMIAQLLAQLGQSLTPQQIGSLTAMLRVDQRAIFGEVMRVAQMSTTPPATSTQPPGNGQANGNPVTPPSPATAPSDSKPQASEMKQ